MCFRDVGGWNLFLAVVSKTEKSGSVLLKYGDCAGQGRCLSSPSYSYNSVNGDIAAILGMKLSDLVKLKDFGKYSLNHKQLGK
jgi:hypothetical protein